MGNVGDTIETLDSITNLLSKGEITTREAMHSYDAISYYANASSLMTQGYYTLALSCIEKSIDSFEKTNILKNYLIIDLSNAWALKSAILFKLNRYDRAVEAAEMSTNIAPYNEYAWLMKGCIYQSIERLSEAIDCYNCTIIANSMNNETIIYANNYRSTCLKQMSPSPSSSNTIAPVYFNIKDQRKVVAKRVGNVYISNLNLGSGENDHYTLNEEWVEIFNNDTKASRLDGLQLCDEDGNSGNNDHIFTIPPIMLFPGRSVRIYSGNGQNSIDLQSSKMSIYWNRISGDPGLYNSPSWKSNRGEIWDNQGDTAYLKDGIENTLSMMSITFSRRESS